MITLAALAIPGAAIGQQLKNWKDLHAAHVDLLSAIGDIEQARSENQYDTSGHAATAEKLLRQAEHELNEAEEAVKSGK